MEQHQHFHFPEKPISPRSPKVIPPAPKLMPNLIYVTHRTSNVRIGSDGTGWYEDEQEKFDDTLGCVVCFRNEHSSERPTGYASHVRACISFYGVDGEELGEGASDVCWIGERRDVNFQVGDRNCLVVIFKAQKSEEWACPFLEAVHTQWGLHYRTEAYPLSETPKKIKIDLFQGNDLLLGCMFDFSVQNGKPLSRRLAP